MVVARVPKFGCKGPQVTFAWKHVALRSPKSSQRLASATRSAAAGGGAGACGERLRDQNGWRWARGDPAGPGKGRIDLEWLLRARPPSTGPLHAKMTGAVGCRPR